MNKITKLVAAVVATTTISLLPFAANASTSQNGTDMVVLNPGGGLTPGGTDGLAMFFNSHEDPEVGSDQVYFAGANQWCCGGAGPVLLVGSTDIGENGAAANNSSTSWDSVAISNTTGAFQRLSGSNPVTSIAKGNATVTLTYTAVVGGRTYTVARAISYVNPHNYYDETWTVTIPDGNTDTVKLYVGGDTAPGGDDNGTGSTQVAGGLRTIYEANPDSGQYIAYSELAADKPFTHYFVGYYSNPYDTITDGNDLPDTTQTSEHDAGLQVQWTFGSTAGTFVKTMRTTVGYNTDIPGSVDPERVALALDLSLDAAVGEVVPGTDVQLQGGGLVAYSPLTLELHSTPIMIDLDGQTADGHGNFSFPVTLPDPIEPGVHSLTLTGIRPDGTPISDVLYFKIGADGKLLWTHVGSALAETGVDAGNYGIAALGLLTAGVAAVAVRRRRAATK